MAAAAALALAPAIIGAGADLFMFHKQEELANTAHQREVADLMKAGINPVMTAETRGAAIPQAPSLGADIQQGLNTGIALRQAAVERERALQEAARARAGAQLDTIRGSQIQAMTPVELSRLQQQIEQGDVTLNQARSIMPDLIARAHQELLAATSGAENAGYLATLNKLAIQGAVNQQELDKMAGAGGPALELLLSVVRAFGPMVTHFVPGAVIPKGATVR